MLSFFYIVLYNILVDEVIKMGRFPSIAAAKAKTGAAKGKLYSMYSRDIYDKAKKGGANPESNFALKQVILVLMNLLKKQDMKLLVQVDQLL